MQGIAETVQIFQDAEFPLFKVHYFFKLQNNLHEI
jgi:hypothetical protein